ncbi:MAG: DUF1415 domain-containing protein [Litorimonas sp.]
MTVSCQLLNFLAHELKYMVDHQKLVRQTQAWLSSVIIAHTLCPFAKREFDKGSIHYAVIEDRDLETQLQRVIQECVALDRDGSRETSLLIFPKGLSEFEDYLDLLEIAGALLKDQGYEGVYQLASFHPQYRFDGTADSNPSNYTNRSPYPMLHILREASVEAALRTYPNPENIPTRNIRVTKYLGRGGMKALLDACYDLSSEPEKQ